MIKQQELLTANIKITNADGHFNVGYESTQIADFLAYIRLAILYLSTMHYICINDGEEIRGNLDKLVKTIVTGLSQDDIPEIRRQLIDVCTSTQSSIAYHRGGKWRRTEKYSTRLLHGKTFFVKNSFSIVGFRPNLGNSAVFLVYDVIQQLDSVHSSLLLESIMRLADIWTSRRPSAWSANEIGFVAAETTFLTNPDIVSRDRVHPAARHWKMGQPITFD